MSRNAEWHQETFGPTSFKKRPQIAGWLTSLEDEGNVVDVRFVEDALSTTVFARVKYIVGRPKITKTDGEGATMEAFKALSYPLIKLLNDHFNPHTEILIDCTGARIVSGEAAVHTDEFVKD